MLRAAYIFNGPRSSVPVVRLFKVAIFGVNCHLRTRHAHKGGHFIRSNVDVGYCYDHIVCAARFYFRKNGFVRRYEVAKIW